MSRTEQLQSYSQAQPFVCVSSQICSGFRIAAWISSHQNGHHAEVLQRTCWCETITSARFQNWCQVFVKATYFHSTLPFKKFSEKNLSPYPIITQVGSLLFMICLPNSMCMVHLVIHVSQPKPTTPNIIPNHVQPPSLPIEVDGELKYEITEILDSKLDCCQRQYPLLYLVHWAEYLCMNKETSWLVATELKHVTDLVTDLHKAYPDKPGPSLQIPTLPLLTSSASWPSSALRRGYCHNCDNSQLIPSPNICKAKASTCEWTWASTTLSTEPQCASEQCEHACHFFSFC